MRPVYFILGSAGSGRREIVFDLIDGGCSPDASIGICIHGSEKKSDVDFGKIPTLKISTRKNVGEQFEISSELDGIDGLFIIANGIDDPTDEVERFKKWLDSSDYELAQIITVVDCVLAHGNEVLQKWYDACIHFSDAVLLNKRDGVSQSWMTAFIKKYEKECYPCAFELVKKGRVSNPAALLDAVPKRISTIFEPVDIYDGIEDDDEDLPDGPVDLNTKEDPYLERLPSGKRCKVIPDIRKYLP